MLCEAVVRHAEDVRELAIPMTGMLLLWPTVCVTPNSAHILSAKIADSVQDPTLVGDDEIEREVSWISWVGSREYKAQVQARIERSQVI